jgi:hypothetical protein
MCLSCGFYNGRQVMDLAAKKQAREARMLAKKEAIKDQSTTPEEVPASETETKQ